MSQDIKQLIERAKGYNIAGVRPQVVSDLLEVLERLTLAENVRLANKGVEDLMVVCLDHMNLHSDSCQWCVIDSLRAENERLKADLAEAKHTEAYWLHEKTMALAEGYEKGRVSALRSQQAAVPAGYKLVPVEPTSEMCKAGFDEGYEETDGWTYASPLETYRAMLAAAPEAPQPSQQAEPVAWLYTGAKKQPHSGPQWEQWSSISDNDHWPVDQWRDIKVEPLYTAPPSEDARDAARYRWLRHGDNDEAVMKSNSGVTWLLRNEKLDAAIDAAMQKGV